VHIKFKDWPLKQLLISSNSWKNPNVTQPIGCVCPGKKAPWLFLPFPSIFLLFKKQKKEQQTESNPMAPWIANPWKSYLRLAALTPVPVSVCLEKNGMPFLPTGQFQNCLHKPTEQTGKQYAPHETPLSTSWKHNQAVPGQTEMPPPWTKLKSMNSEL
jgi:hypothetical protein